MIKNTNIFVLACLITASVQICASKPLATVISATTKSSKEFVKPACPTRPAPKRPDTPNVSKYSQSKVFQQKRWSLIMTQAQASSPVHNGLKSDDTLPATGYEFGALIPVPMGSDAETVQAGLLTK